MLGALALAMDLPAAEAPAAAERVGDLGRKECLEFEGTQTFSRAGILDQLDMRLEFYGRSDPAAPLVDYVAWIERVVRQGYQRSGFAKVAVQATADRAAQRIRVNVAEGPRFKCGAVRVTGLDAALTEQLTNRLQEAAALGESTKSPGQPFFYWPWREGSDVPADPASQAGLARNLVAALAELNWHGAEAQVELALDETRRQADLLVQVRKPGVVGTLEQIEVEGLRLNSRDDLLSFLQLRPGMPVTGNVTNDVLQRLWESGRFNGHFASLSPLAEPGRFKLDLALVEFAHAPPLKQELTAEQQAFLKVREWLLDWKSRPEDWLIELEGTRSGRRFSAEIALGQEGLAILIRQVASATNPPALRYAFVAAPQHLGFYSGSQRSKLVGKKPNLQVESFVALTGNPKDGDAHGGLSVGAKWHTKSAGMPYSMRLELAPVAFVASAHLWEKECHLGQGRLSVRSQADENPAYEVTADAATGRLLGWRMASRTNDARLAVRFEEGAFARVLREVAVGSEAFTNALDPQHPWSSSLAMLGRDLRETLEKDFPEALDWAGKNAAGLANARELLDAVPMLEDLPWSELLAPLDLFAETASETDSGEDFPFVIEDPLTSKSTGSDWVRLLGGMMLRANETLYLRGSWPWAILRDATFLAAGESRWATNDTARLAQSEDTGPLGCLIAAHALGRFDPRLAMIFSERGAARTTPAALQGDLRVLLRGEPAGPKFLRSALQRAPLFKEQELRTLMKLFGTNALPLALDCVAALKANPNLPPDEVMRAAMEQHWEKAIRPRLLTEFAKSCLTGYQAVSPLPDATRAALATGWLRGAAEQGYAPAQMFLGQLYVQGLGVSADPQAAARWMRQAADQHYPHSACELGRLYLKLDNREQADRWLRIGAQENCASAEIGLAQLLLNQKVAPRDQQEEGINLLRKAAEHGSAEAEFYLGMILEQQNKMDEALGHYRQAATKGVLQAQMKLGDLLSDGVSTTPDYVEAWVWLAQVAHQGNRMAAAQARRVERKLDADQLREAKRRLRQPHQSPGAPGIRTVEQPTTTSTSPKARPMTLQGNPEVTQKPDPDIPSLKAKAENGDAKAQNELGEVFRLGKLGAATNQVEAVKWFRKAAEQGNASAQHRLGVAFYHGTGGLPRDWPEAIHWFRKAAEQGYAKGQYMLDFALVLSQGVENAEARQWLQKAADQGYVFAQVALGTHYWGPDLAEAVKWFRKAADQGHPMAHHSLGLMYQAGDGVPKDIAEALKWHRRAAELGWAPAQVLLGKMYTDGDGVPKDAAEAIKWYRMAADYGDSGAQRELGIRFAEGNGVPTNNVSAYLWFDLAARSFQDAVNRRTTLAKQMTPEQIAEAKELSAQFVPRQAPPLKDPPW
jgi:TPR repeat protein